MEPTVEQRLDFLENRVKTLEGLLETTAAPVPAPAVRPTAKTEARGRCAGAIAGEA